jgi:hypothetical protein
MGQKKELEISEIIEVLTYMTEVNNNNNCPILLVERLEQQRMKKMHVNVVLDEKFNWKTKKEMV